MINEEKQKALEAALGQIEKHYGKGSVMKLGESGANMQVETVPTGSLSLDIALGVRVPPIIPEDEPDFQLILSFFSGG